MDANEYIRAAPALRIHTERFSVHLLKWLKYVLRHRRLRSLAEQAVAWRARIVSGNASKQEFTAWLLKSADHVQVWLELTAFDEELAQALRRRDAATSASVRKSNVVEFTPYSALSQPVPGLPRPPGKPARTSVWAGLAAAGLAVCVMCAALVSQQYLTSERVVATGAGEWRRMRLSDGTTIHLDARSIIEVNYQEHGERIVHVYKGNVVFDVAKDPNRPFIARTPLVDAIAVGTRFGLSVDRGVTTTVSEGRVQVAIRGKTNTAPVVLTANQQLHVPDSSVTQLRLAQVDAERSLQWANGQLVLEGLTVAQGAEQFNRRNRQQIIIESPTLARKVLAFASVNLDSPESYAKLVAAEPGVTMEIDEDNRVIRLSE